VITILTPCFNEKAVLPAFYEKVSAVLQKWTDKFEVILVDDGSTDDTWKVISQFNRLDPRWKGIRFARNFGQQKAISAGLWNAVGDCAIILDADLQDPPDEMNHFIQKWKEGFEVVYAIRIKRKEWFLKKLCYRGFYKLLHSLSETNIPCDSGDFCLMDRKVIDVLNSMPEQDRFVRGMRAWAGFRQIGLEYERDRRVSGEPKYGTRKLMRLAFSGISSFSVAPLQATTLMGVVVAAVALLGISALFLCRTFCHAIPQIVSFLGCSGMPLALLFLGGIQLICIGILGGYMGRVYMEVKRRPLWIIADSVGIKPRPLSDRPE
jgi:polyisoprenyl-phosphate glycosyltransferase